MSKHRSDNGKYILGGGVTGLAAGITAGLPVLEAAAQPGGICSSYYVRPGSETRLPEPPADGNAYRFEIGGGLTDRVTLGISGGLTGHLGILKGGAGVADVVLRGFVHRGLFFNLGLGATSHAPQRNLVKRPGFGGIAGVGYEFRPLRVLGMHLDLSGLLRRDQIRAVLKHCHGCETARPTVLMGDFNQWGRSAGAFREFAEGWHVPMIGNSFPSRRPLAPLDRIVHSAELICTQSAVHHSALAVAASDHLPVRVTLELA